MSYDVMVFNCSKVPNELGQLKKYFYEHIENDMPKDNTPHIFNTFLENIKKVFPSINDCPGDKTEYACNYSIYEDFIYMCFGYSVAKEAHDIVKHQAKADNLGFWDTSQSFDRTFPITLPADKWPMVLEASWINNKSQFVYNYEEVRKVLMQMKTPGQSSICLTGRYGNYIQAGGYNNTFIVETRKYINAIEYQHLRADLKSGISDADTVITINNFNIKVPLSQILSQNQVCLLFREFTDGIKPDSLDISWKKLEI